MLVLSTSNSIMSQTFHFRLSWFFGVISTHLMPVWDLYDDVEWRFYFLVLGESGWWRWWYQGRCWIKAISPSEIKSISMMCAAHCSQFTLILADFIISYFIKLHSVLFACSFFLCSSTTFTPDFHLLMTGMTWIRFSTRYTLMGNLLIEAHHEQYLFFISNLKLFIFCIALLLDEVIVYLEKFHEPKTLTKKGTKSFPQQFWLGTLFFGWCFFMLSSL